VGGFLEWAFFSPDVTPLFPYCPPVIDIFELPVRVTGTSHFDHVPKDTSGSRPCFPPTFFLFDVLIFLLFSRNCLIVRVVPSL